MRYPIAPQIDWDQTDAEVKINVWIPSVEVEDLRCTLKCSFITVEVEPYLLVSIYMAKLKFRNLPLRSLTRACDFGCARCAFLPWFTLCCYTEYNSVGYTVYSL
jgi:hypothetical protein